MSESPEPAGAEALRVAIVGATGYTGAEAVRLLAAHPRAKVTVVTGRADAGRPLAELYPHLGDAGAGVLEAFDAAEIARRADVALLGLPHAAAAEHGAALLEAGVKVIDLSADFRLRDAAVYAEWYGIEHPAPALLDRAVYGLPERYRARIRNADLVASPGCYPTATLLAALPLVEEGLVGPGGIIADCKSGVTGAGRSPKVTSLFSEVGESLSAYGVGRHRHAPEIAQELAAAAAGDGARGERVDDAGEAGGARPSVAAVPLVFTPHLVPMARGILATVYLDLADDLDTDALLERYRTRYADEPFVRIVDPARPPATGHVRGTNRCDVTVLRLPGMPMRAVAIAAIDNLVKGAAGQAIQSMNLRFGLPETMGLPTVGVFP
jgi:N-acetyl-gamma-glutamyl-phosphate reductase